MGNTSKKKRNKSKYKSKKKPYAFSKKTADSISAIFLIYMFTVFPLFLDDGYLNVTITKYMLFTVATIIFAVAMIPILILRFCDYAAYNKMSCKKLLGSRLLPSDIFMALFLLAGFFSWLMADNKTNAFTGETGRRCGFAFVLVVTALYFTLSRGCNIKQYIMPVFACSSFAAYMISILQHFDIDVFGLISQISTSQRDMFISTFGNINVFGSFVVLTMALFSGMFIFEEKKEFKILYAVVIFFGGAAIIAANSDVTYAGLAAYLITLLFVALYKEKFSDYIFVLLITTVGYTLMLLIINVTGKGLDKLTGINVVFNHMEILGIICVALILISILCKLIPAKTKKKLHINKVISMIAASCVIIAAAISVFVIGIKNEWDLFEFNDYWGSYRGYVWTRLITLYKDFPVLNKIFGNGNETVYELMYVNYYDEMYSLTGTVYDSAHNQYLQYLVTMGIFGVVSYIGLIITSVYNCIKVSKDNAYAFPIMATIIAFAAQEFFNIGQPVTTPFMFLFIALAAGLLYNHKVNAF